MSKSIWHTKNEKPEPCKTFVFKTDKGNTCSDMLSTNSDWNPILLPEFYSMDDFDKAERITKWCYLDDLLALETENKDLSDKIGKLETELDRTKKALDLALDALKEIDDRYESEEQRGREEDDSPDWWDFSMDTGEILAKALTKINETLKQKDVK